MMKKESVTSWWSNNENRQIQQVRNNKISKTRNKKFSYLWTTRECHYCGSIFKINIKNIYLSNWGKYCSKICKCSDMIGKPAWNKGLNKETDDRVLNLARNRSKAGNPSGINACNWRGGLSFEPYTKEFNKKLKFNIKKRDNFKCQECNVPEMEEQLFVHYISA